MKKLLLLILLLPAISFAQNVKEPTKRYVKSFYPDLGNYFNMYVGNRMPFTDAFVEKDTNAVGKFVVDYGTDTSVVDITGFPGRSISKSADHKYALTLKNWDIYSANARQYGNEQWLGGIQANGIREAGIIGTDILSNRIVTFDYVNSRIYIVMFPDSYGKREHFQKYGFVAVRAEHFAPHQPGTENHDNNPMVKMVFDNGVDSAQALAFIDPGYDDKVQLNGVYDTNYTHVININQKYLSNLIAKGVQIRVDKSRFFTLDNVSAKPDTLFQCFFATKYQFNLVGENGETVIPYSTDECNVFLKVNAPGGAAAGGITTYSYPAAQFGGSILMDCDMVGFDPFKGLVWFLSDRAANAIVRPQNKQ